MDTTLIVLVVVVLVALAFDYINGFHDTANAVATVVSTGVMPLRLAIGSAALLNFLGALVTGTAVASTIGKGIVAAALVSQGVVLGALLGAIVWNLLTWWFGIPSSSSHALIGGLVGAAMVKGGAAAVQWGGILGIVKSLVTSPLLGLVGGVLVMTAVLWLTQLARPAIVEPITRKLQIGSALLMALSHGSNDAQKTMGIITMSLVAAGYLGKINGQFVVPLWVMIAAASAMALGTAMGGMKIIKTMGTGIIDLRPIHGFAAETTAAMIILSFSHVGLPVSTTHVITGSIMGVGASRALSAVRWGVTSRILWAWVLTIPLSAAVSALCYLLLAGVFGVA